MNKIPQWLTDKIESPPEAGTGVHAWLFSCARNLHAHMGADEITGTLKRASAQCGRPVPLKEVQDAVRNSYAVAWRPGGQAAPDAALKLTPAGAHTPERWPRRDVCAVAARCADSRALGVEALYDLWENSPSRHLELGGASLLELLFPSAKWLCLAGAAHGTARTRPPGSWAAADALSLIVPSPMTGPSGKTQDGSLSHRCLENTGPRRWLVIEFDTGSIDEQSQLHFHLSHITQAMGWPPLKMVVHSGGKSLHGWYGPCDSEQVSRELMAYAVSLGADPATWTRCQLVRLPNGKRSGAKPEMCHDLPPGFSPQGGAREQSVYYFSPNV